MAERRRTYVLLQTEPRSWLQLLLERLVELTIAEADDIAVEPPGPVDRVAIERALLTARRVRFTSNAGGARVTLLHVEHEGTACEVTLNDEQAAQVRAWVSEHGDDFDHVFRLDSALANKRPNHGVRLRPGDTATYDAYDLQCELRGAVVHTSYELDGSMLQLHAVGQRLVPGSGPLGQLGRYPVTVTVDQVQSVDVEDPNELIGLPVTSVHIDPALGRLELSHPALGSITVFTAASCVEVAIGAAPLQVRRWMRWRDATPSA